MNCSPRTLYFSALAAVLAAGCGGATTAGTCTATGDCGSGQVCQSGVCVQPPTTCNIDGGTPASGALNPDNPCQSCQPDQKFDGWTDLPDGTACGAGAVCSGGTCSSGCLIGGQKQAEDAGNPDNPCESCAGAVSTTAWTPRPDGFTCASGSICDRGACQVGCFIDGAAYGPNTTNPNNGCQKCDPSGSGGTQGWSPVTDGPNASCAAGEVCHAGQCAAGCAIQNIYYATGAAEPTNPCLVCAPATSTTAWTPGNEGASTGCSSGQVCHNGLCTAGCFAASSYQTPDAVNAQNACETCQPAVATQGYTALADATSCNADGQHFCRSDVCVSGCVIPGIGVVDAGAAKSNNPCQSCQPAVSTTDYSPVGNGGACPGGAGHICFGGSCQLGCYINGAFQNANDTNGTNACQACKPASSTSQWTNVEAIACGSGNYCHAGTCQSGCVIGGTFYAPNAANPANECQQCRPATSKTTWSAVANDTSCNGGDGYCQTGTCRSCPLCGNLPCCPPGTCSPRPYTCL